MRATHNISLVFVISFVAQFLQLLLVSATFTIVAAAMRPSLSTRAQLPLPLLLLLWRLRFWLA